MKSVADWLQRGYTEAVLMETGMRRNECMKRLSKVSCGLLLTASLLIGAMLSGCGQTTDYTAEIKEYQNKLESLAAENEELKAQLGITETQSTEETQTAAETENQSQEMVSENQTTETGVQQVENTDNSGDEMKILVLGDSIWGNYRDDTGVSARLAACLAQKGKNPDYLEGLISSLKSKNGELPWNLYLKKIMGTIEANKKKTITRRSRRQPNRLDLRGELRNHKAEIAVAIDISGSISDEEFKQAIKEVLSIVKNHNHEITIIECDREIKRAYKVKKLKDVQDRISTGGGTEFSPVFEYLNNNKIKKYNMLIYFTDGKGETELKVKPKGYKVLWVISGKGDKISLKNPYGAVKNLSKVEEKNKGNMLDLKDVMYDGYSMNNQQPIL